MKILQVCLGYNLTLGRAPYEEYQPEPKEAKELFGRFFNNIQVEVHYNVIDLLGERKTKVGLPDKYELG